MEVPPPSSEDKTKAEPVADSTAAPKKRASPRSRLTRAKSSKPAKTAKAAAAAETAAREPSLPFEPAPVERVERVERPPVKVEHPAPAPAPAQPSAPAPVPQVENQAPSGMAESAPAAAPDQTAAQPQSQPPAHNQSGGDDSGQYQQPHGGGGGGGGKFGRWRDKKFRGGGGGGGGGGGKWNKHQGGGGGGPGGNAGPKHPPQPPPPKLEIHYGDLPDPARFQDPVALDRLADEIASSAEEPIWLPDLYDLGHADLSAKALRLGAKFEGVPNRMQLLGAVFAAAVEKKIPLLDQGCLDLTDRGYGFIVHGTVNYRLYPENSFLSEGFVRKHGLKRGHQVEVQVQAPQGNDRCPAVVRLRKVMGGEPAEILRITPFEELTPYYPLKRIWLERPEQKDVSMRMVDIITPVGFGQRGLIVAPPRTGKTVLLQNIANSVAINSPDAKLIILLIDERPEEVTDFRRHCKGEIVSSTFDETPESHVHCAEMVIEKARRMVEQGDHVVILLDSITRLARAYNALASNSGKIMSGGLEANALQKPKRFFGSARNIEGAGSLTILGTALIDTGSRMDEIIFEEFKGTGNMELHLDRDLVNKRIFPALNIDKSGTRKEELIYHPEELARIYSLRRAMQGVPAADSMDMLIGRLKKTKTNAEFLLSLNR
jgi:transcription termination factor Rho